MTFCRSVSLGRLTNILVPRTNPTGFARNLSRSASSQVTFHRGGDIEAWNRAALAADNTGERGPDLVHVRFRRMTTAQWLANTVWPAEGSPAANAVGELPSKAISTRPVLHNDGLIS